MIKGENNVGEECTDRASKELIMKGGVKPSKKFEGILSLYFKII